MYHNLMAFSNYVLSIKPTVNNYVFWFELMSDFYILPLITYYPVE